MIDAREYSRLKSVVNDIRHGKLLVSDRVADHVDELAATVFGETSDQRGDFAHRPWSEGWDRGVASHPQQAREWVSATEELLFLTDQVLGQQGEGLFIGTKEGAPDYIGPPTSSGLVEMTEVEQ